MLSVSQLAELAQAAYTSPATYQCRNDIHATSTIEDGVWVIACRGTVSFDNWRVDLDADPVWCKGIGFVHEGIWRAAEDLWSMMDNEALAYQGDMAFVGHSLGASLALAMAAHCILDGGKPPTVVALAPAKVSGPGLAKLLKPATIHAYRRANDLVTQVPWLPIIYGQPAPLTHLRPRETLAPIAAHDCAGYVADIAALERTQAHG